MNLRIRRKSSSIVAEVGLARQDEKAEYSLRQSNNSTNTSRTYEKTTLNTSIVNGPHGYQHNQLLFQAQCQQRRNVSELLMIQSQNNSPQRQAEQQLKSEDYPQQPRSSSSHRDKNELGGQVKITRFFNFPINDSHKVMMAPKYAYPNYLQLAEKEKGRFLIPIKRVIDRVISNKSPLLVELHRKITQSENHNTHNTSQIEDDKSSESSRNMTFVEDINNNKCTCNSSQVNDKYNDFRQKINSFNTTYSISNQKNISMHRSSNTRNRSYNCSPSNNHSPKGNYSTPGNTIIHQNSVNNSCRSSINGLFMQPRRKLQQYGRLQQNQSQQQPWPYKSYNQQNQDSSAGGYYCPSPKQSPSRRQFAQVILDSPIKRRSLSTAEKISRNISNQEQINKQSGNSQVQEQNNFMLSPYNLER